MKNQNQQQMIIRKIQKIVEFTSYSFELDTYIFLGILIAFIIFKNLVMVPVEYTEQKTNPFLNSVIGMSFGIFSALVISFFTDREFRIPIEWFYTFFLPILLFDECWRVDVEKLGKQFSKGLVYTGVSHVVRFLVFYKFLSWWDESLNWNILILLCSVLCLSEISLNKTPIPTGIMSNIIVFSIFRGFYRQNVRIQQGTAFIAARFFHQVLFSCSFYLFFSLSFGFSLYSAFSSLLKHSSQEKSPVNQVGLIILSAAGLCFFGDLFSLQGVLCMMMFLFMLRWKKPFTQETHRIVGQVSYALRKLIETILFLSIGFETCKIFLRETSNGQKSVLFWAFILSLAIMACETLLGFFFSQWKNYQGVREWVLLHEGFWSKNLLAFILCSQLSLLPQVFQQFHMLVCVLCLILSIFGSITSFVISFCFPEKIFEQNSGENSEKCPEKSFQIRCL